MRTSLIIRTAACFTVCATLVACAGEGTSPDLPNDQPAEVTALLSELGASQAAGAASVNSGGTTAPSTSTSSSDAPPCVFDAPTMSFKCPTRTLPNGLTMNSYFQLLDASNYPQSAFDTATTSAIRLVNDITGTTSQPLNTPAGPVPATQTMVQHNDMVLSGLRTGTKQQNGTGTMSVTIVAEGMPTANITGTTTFANITFPPPPQSPPTPQTPFYPLSGTITSDLSSQTGSSPVFTTHQVTTYNGTAIATTVITMPGGVTRTCTYDMSKPPGTEPPTCTNS